MRKAGREGAALASWRAARGPRGRASPRAGAAALSRRDPARWGPRSPRHRRRSEPFPDTLRRAGRLAREIFVREWVRVSGSGSRQVWAPWAQPRGGGAAPGNPQLSQAETPHPVGSSWPPALSGPPLMHSPARTLSPHPDPLWDTPRDTQRLTLACGPSPSPSDARTLHPRCTFAHHRGAHTFHP